jgi:6-phosphogluconolactonase
VTSIEVVIRDAPADALVAMLVSRAREAIARAGTFSLALPGGSVATTCLPRLAEADLDWSAVHLFWGDERAVAPDHPDSNFGLAKRLLVDRVPIDASHVHRMRAEALDLAEAAAAYEAVLRGRTLDAALLGVGPDGHVCSLFPGDALLDEDTRWVAVIERSPKPPPRRLTLTLPALGAAGAVIVVATGEGKAPVIREAVEDVRSRLPLALALRRARTATVLLDPGAASHLRV